LLGAIASKFVYSALLAVVIFGTVTIGGLVGGRGGIGAFMTLLVLAGFWWAIFLKRDDLLRFVSVSGEEGGSSRLSRMAGLATTAYLGKQAAGAVSSLAGRGGGGRGASGDRPGLASGIVGSPEDRAAGGRQVATQQLDRSAERSLEGRYEAARGVLGGQEKRRGELGETEARIEQLRAGGAASAAGVGGGEGAAVAAGGRGAGRDASGSSPGVAGTGGGGGDRAAELSQLQERAAARRAEIAHHDPAETAARGFVGAADERQSGGAPKWGRGEHAGAIETLRHQANRPVEDGAHAWRVGKTPEQYERLSGRERIEAHKQVGSELKGDKLALGTIPDRPEGAPSAAASRRFRRHQRRKPGGIGRLAEARLGSWRDRRGRSRRGISR
jgi:hypothetical protein